MKERVQKLLAQANLGSRRACEELIRAGRVKINGKVAELGAKADPSKDEIMVDDSKLSFAKLHKVYIALYKPLNVLSTDKPHKSDHRQTVRELVPVDGHLFTIGRLDAESEGLMVLTNDGEMAQKLAHPRYNHTKTYKVIVYGLPTAETLETWRSGVHLEEGLTAPCSVDVMYHGNGLATLQIVMKEGKKRQIRRIASMLGHPVKRLIRTHIGRLGLGTLKQGEWRKLTETDLTAMQTPAEALRFIRERQRSRFRKPAAAEKIKAARPRRFARAEKSEDDPTAANPRPRRKPVKSVDRPTGKRGKPTIQRKPTSPPRRKKRP